MKATKQESSIVEYNLQPFAVQVLSKERTFCEKIMSPVGFSRTEDPYTDLANKIRHVYNIHLMLRNKEVQSFFESKKFDQMLIQVGKDDVVNYKNNNEWISKHPATALLFSDPDNTGDKIKNTYRTTFKEGRLENIMKLMNGRVR